jgi:hypothetical protein
MFETPETKGETSGMGKWVGILVAVAIVVGGVLFYMTKKNSTSSTVPVASAAAAAPLQSNADAAKDLRVISQKLDKDFTGTTAVWSVELRNVSQTYAYTNIQYQTTYMRNDGTVLGTNTGTIPSLALDAGESQAAQFRDPLYPSGTELFKVTITGATASK